MPENVQMLDYVEIDGVDVTEKRITWEHEAEWMYAIDTLTIDLSPSIYDLIPDLGPGSRIIVKRGWVTATDEFIIDGDVTQVRPQVDRVQIVAKGRMNDAVKSGRVKSWDKDIDTEQGIGSEIFKSICDHCQLNYDDLTIPPTGGEEVDKIVKFIQNDEDDFEMMNKLTELYERIIYYDYSVGKVNWQQKGVIVYTHPLVVGIDIQNQIKWKENMEQLINKVKVHGATVYDKINPAVFAGPATFFQLTKTPEDTEVRQGSSTGTLYRRGQKNVGTAGTDWDYYVDVEKKQIIFPSNMSNIWVRYGAQVPMPIVATNPDSIVKYGGPNAIPHFKAFTFNDLKDIADAEDRARTILNKYSTPFYETREDVQIEDSVLQTYGIIKPGHLIHITDDFNGYDLDLFVKIVKKSFPHIGDRLTIGDEIWRTEDWQAETMKKINLLFADLNKNQDLLITAIDNSTSTTFENRFIYLEKRDIMDSFILGNYPNNLIGTTRLGWRGTAYSISKMAQGQNTYKEFVNDSLFYDSVNSTRITWNTTTMTITFASNGVLITNALTMGINWDTILLELAAPTGTFTKFEISQDNKSTWEEITEDTVYNIVSTAENNFFLRITAGVAGATLENTYDVLGSGAFLQPAIKLTFG